MMLLTLALLYGCAANSAAENDTEFVNRIGVIKGKEVVDPENAGSDKQTCISNRPSESLVTRATADPFLLTAITGV